MLFKCKICGGELEIKSGANIAQCPYCGTKQTLPRLDSERRANLYDRANHFRRNNDFDRALGLYEAILSEDNTDAEAHWSCVLCRFGIAYVEDPATHRRVPTCNRTLHTSIYMDADYQAALAHAQDSAQRQMYEEEARQIDALQKHILAVSSQEAPFDVFICYKETDAAGQRTPDSVLAGELYQELTDAGYKVFFSRITLEDKLGAAYEPYIFAALSTARVMVVIGTRPEYFTAVWVRNEWSRYLALIAQGEKKVLIPAYRDMDPYDLPEAFSHLQAQDMSKLGFMQDLLRGIEKIAPLPKAAADMPDVVARSAQPDTDALIRRLYLFLEDGEWQQAARYCEKVLDRDPESALAYVGRLMVALRVRFQDELADCALPFDDSSDYEKALRFGDAALKSQLQGYNQAIRNRIMDNRYTQAVQRMRKAQHAKDYLDAAEQLRALEGYRDADALAAQCAQAAEEARRETTYQHALQAQETDTLLSQEEALRQFESITDYRDSAARAADCRRRIDLLRDEKARQEYAAQQEEIRSAKMRVRKRIIAGIAIIVFALAAAGLFTLFTEILPARRLEETYTHAVEAFDAADYSTANRLFSELGDYRESEAYRAQIPWSSLQPGDLVLFGEWVQGKYNFSPAQAISWRILAQEDNKVLLLSEHVLAVKPFLDDDPKYASEWGNASIRTWLNEDFYMNAFTQDEQLSIVPFIPAVEDSGGSPDRVFLLSVEEAKTYLQVPSKAAIATATQQAAQFLFGNKETPPTRWWLRSRSDRALTSRIMLVNEDGNLSDGYPTFEEGIRPAIWVELEY
nr:DUF6273 domain-containing protein [Maliibacterium massiliense]